MQSRLPVVLGTGSRSFCFLSIIVVQLELGLGLVLTLSSFLGFQVLMLEPLSGPDMLGDPVQRCLELWLMWMGSTADGSVLLQ